MAAVDESADAGAEMTEEEWNLRVAELNKHQVCLCNVEILVFYYIISHIKIKINTSSVRRKSLSPTEEDKWPGHS